MPTTLEAKYFRCPELFALESRCIFQQSWLAVARSSDLQEVGAFLVVSIEGHDLLLIRSESGLRCFHNVCRHRGTTLLTERSGQLSGGCIVCPYHAWKYALDGQLVGAPNMREMPDFDRQSHGLGELPCASWLGFIMVSLNPDLNVLTSAHREVASHFAPWQLENLQTAARLKYDVAANWKFIMQNYSECYHCPTVHPALHKLTNYRNTSNDLTSGPVLGGPMELNDGCETMSLDGKQVGGCLPGLNDQQRRQVFYYVAFPNLLLSLHPDYVMAHRLYRQATNETHVVCEFYFSAESAPGRDLDPSRATQFWDEVNRQDWHVCELSQRGAQSPGYRPGPYSAAHESMLVAFDEHYLGLIERDS